MRSVVLVPYCPLPVDTGGKREMWKHLEILKSLGECRIVSAAHKPVGAGWTSEKREEIERMGYSITLREESCSLSAAQVFGIFYAAVCKGLGMEKAFGHSNPYHRHAFPAEWWMKCTEDADLAVINYSYWSWLPCSCPKVVVLLDLWSDYMWEGPANEIKDLSSSDLVVVISKDEEEKLNKSGIGKTVWSPPSVKSIELPVNDVIGLVGSPSKFNIEGLRWIEESWTGEHTKVRVYGGLADYIGNSSFLKVGCYADSMQPYRDCGIILATTALGMGLQIKTIEALAMGRAIVARKGAMRGLPPGNGAWIEVGTSNEMYAAALKLHNDSGERLKLSSAAKDYYNKNLRAENIENQLVNAYRKLIVDDGGKFV